MTTITEHDNNTLSNIDANIYLHETIYDIISSIPIVISMIVLYIIEYVITVIHIIYDQIHNIGVYTSLLQNSSIYTQSIQLRPSS